MCVCVLGQVGGVLPWCLLPVCRRTVYPPPAPIPSSPCASSVSDMDQDNRTRPSVHALTLFIFLIYITRSFQICCLVFTPFPFSFHVTSCVLLFFTMFDVFGVVLITDRTSGSVTVFSWFKDSDMKERLSSLWSFQICL